MADADVSYDLNMCGVCLSVCANLSNRCIDRKQSTCQGPMTESESEEERPVPTHAFQVRLPTCPFTPKYSLRAKSRPDIIAFCL